MYHLAGASSPMPQVWAASLYAAVASTVVLGVLLPFAASLILDGVVILLIRRQLRGVLLGLTLTAIVACTGFALAAAARPSASSFIQLPAVQHDVTLLLPLTSALAVLAFISRQVRGIKRGR